MLGFFPGILKNVNIIKKSFVLHEKNIWLLIWIKDQVAWLKNVWARASTDFETSVLKKMRLKFLLLFTFCANLDFGGTKIDVSLEVWISN